MNRIAGIAIIVGAVIVLIGAVIINNLSGQVSDLQLQMSQLSNPSDPLSAYNQVCQDNNMTNTSTGITQTYYYPCTSRFIPQPG